MLKMLKKFYYWFHRITSKPQERGGYSSGYWQHQVRKRVFELYDKYCEKVLEVGCGEGLFLAELASVNKNTQVYGIDNREGILQKADERLKEKGIENVRLSQADATSLPFEDSYFDAVVCINVIFNLESKEIVRKVLGEIARVCKKGGRVIVDFRNSKNPFLYIKYRLAPYYDQTVKGLPLKTYNIEDMRFFSEKSGLKIIRQVNIGFPLQRIAPIIVLELEKQGP